MNNEKSNGSEKKKSERKYSKHAHKFETIAERKSLYSAILIKLKMEQL